ncbi:MAG: hypothetical protein EBT86_01240 [Actinobacteria bacterium]|nr:hypothetical protein [Actinomycetota bacterium]
MSSNIASSALSAFNAQLVGFFEELVLVFPEERDVKSALEAIKGAKRINPRLILDLFYNHIYTEFGDAIQKENLEFIQVKARNKIQKEFNEVMPALVIFDKHWDGLII